MNDHPTTECRGYGTYALRSCNRSRRLNRCDLPLQWVWQRRPTEPTDCIVRDGAGELAHIRKASTATPLGWSASWRLVVRPNLIERTIANALIETHLQVILVVFARCGWITAQPAVTG